MNATHLRIQAAPSFTSWLAHPALLSVGLSLVGVATPANAGDPCLDYRTTTHQVSGIDVGNDGNVLAWTDSRLYANSGGNTRTAIYDISDTAAPLKLADDVDTCGDAASVARGDYLFQIGTFGFADLFCVVDASNPEIPAVVAEIEGFPIGSGPLVMVGEYIYAEAAVIDVTDPTDPVLTALPAEPKPFATDGTVLYAVDRVTDELQVLSVAEPLSPAVIGTLSGFTPDLSVRPVFMNGRMFTSVFANGGTSRGVRAVKMIDVSDPASPFDLGTLDMDAGSLGAWTAGGQLFADDRAFDVTDPTEPVEAPSPGTVRLVVGNHLYGPGVFRLVAPHVDPVVAEYASSRRIEVESSRLYMGQSDRIDILDVTDPTSPIALGVLTRAGEFAVRSEVVYVATADGLEIYDVADPGSPLLLGSWPTAPTTYFYFRWPHAWVGAPGDLGGISTHVIDVSEPSTPIHLGETDLGSRIAVDGDLLMTVEPSADDGVAGGLLYDVSDVANPIPLGSLFGLRGPVGVVLDVPFAYVVTGSPFVSSSAPDEMVVVDVSDPASPEIRKRVPLFLDDLPIRNELRIRDEYLYTIGGGGLAVFDIGDPLNAGIVGAAWLPGSHDDLALGDYAFLDGDGGTFVLPLECSGVTPVVLTEFRGDVIGNQVRVSWSTSSEARHAGFNLYRCASRTTGCRRMNPELIRGRSPYVYMDPIGTQGGSRWYQLGAVDTSGEETRFGPVFVDVAASVATGIMAPRPNPFEVDVKIPFETSEAGEIRIRLYDVSGRMVRSLANTWFEAGRYSLRWDGRSDTGQDVQAGVYFYELMMGEARQTRRIVKLDGRR